MTALLARRLLGAGDMDDTHRQHGEADRLMGEARPEWHHQQQRDNAERRLRQLTIATTISVDAGPDRWSACLEGDTDVDDLEAALTGGAATDAGPQAAPGVSGFDTTGEPSAGAGAPTGAEAGAGADDAAGWLPAGSSPVTRTR